MGAGTRNSPITIDDSEDEVFNELYQSLSKASPQNPPTILAQDRRVSPPLPLPFPTDTANQPSDSKPAQLDKKRKRAGSFSPQDIGTAGPSNVRHPNPSLVNRLSQPEGKKARKRRRKAERQALEEARVQNLNWLTKTVYPAFRPSALQPSSWGPVDLYGGLTPQHVPSPREEISYLPHIEPQGMAYRYPYDSLPERQPVYEGYNRHSPSPPVHIPRASSSSDWVSSMALAADPFNRGEFPNPPPPSLPPARLDPPPIHPQITPTQPKFENLPAAPPKPVEQHALPSKPPATHPGGTIGMMPDLDPSSKHGTFHITPSTKEGGTDMKKRGSAYIPNPARTLVMERLPKTHRNPDFINSWCRSACGFAPVHFFIDGPDAKALIEFATAELARKAWASPRLGHQNVGLKPPQLKGKIRDDLIRVWWYRVDGVGARAGVGEIEEGEIEGDISLEKEKAQEDEGMPKKESKKERKARLAREREAKRLKQLEFSNKQLERQMQQQQAMPLLSTTGPHSNVDVNALLSSVAHIPAMFQVQAPFANDVPTWTALATSQQFQISSSADNYRKKMTAYGASLQNNQDERQSISSSIGESSVADMAGKQTITTRQNDNLEDYEEMDMEVDELSPSPVDTSAPPLPQHPPPPPPPPPTIPPPNPLHSSLPARPVQPQPQNPLSLKPPTSYQPSPTARVFVPRAPQNLPATSVIPPVKKPVISSQAKPPPHRPAPSIQAPHPKPPPPEVSSPPVNAAAAPPPSASSSIAPSPAASDSRAEKSTPTEPSFTKRTLLARQKELEEKIAKSKQQIAAAAAVGKTAGSTPAAAPAPAPPVRVQPPPVDDEDGKQAMEDRLRRLVLQSRKPAVQTQSKISATPNAPPAVSDQRHLQRAPEPEPQPAKTPVSATPAPEPASSLEEMAVSFITQTIETIKARPGVAGETVAAAGAAAPAPARGGAAAAADVRMELAAKQRRLEEHISESKSLMSQLAQARTKSEKDAIMRVMREKTRQFEEASASEMKTRAAAPATHQFGSSRWVPNSQDAMIFIVSDDEDEDDDDDDDDDMDDDED